MLGVLLGKLAHLGWAVIVPLMFNPWWAVVTFYAVCSWCVGFGLAVIFQLAHCVDIAERPDADASRRGDDFAVHQLRTTVDIASPMPLVGHRVPLGRRRSRPSDRASPRAPAPAHGLPHGRRPVPRRMRRARDRLPASTPGSGKRCARIRGGCGPWERARSARSDCAVTEAEHRGTYVAAHAIPRPGNGGKLRIFLPLTSRT